MFSKPQLDRYSRQLILPGVGASGQRALLNARVLVIGTGGLGSPVLLYLAAAGVGTLGLVDDDSVELSNLQRQVIHGTKSLGQEKVVSAQQRLEALNPEVKLEVHPVRLTEANALELLAPFDLVIDGSDNLPTRYLASDTCVKLGKPLVYGAMAQFEGQFALLCGAPGAPCYRCLYPEPPPAGAIPSCAEAGVLGALPGVIGSLMATEALKYLLGLGETNAKLTHYDTLAGTFRAVKLRRNPVCPSCGDTPSCYALAGYEAHCEVS